MLLRAGNLVNMPFMGGSGITSELKLRKRLCSDPEVSFSFICEDRGYAS